MTGQNTQKANNKQKNVFILTSDVKVLWRECGVRKSHRRGRPPTGLRFWGKYLKTKLTYTTGINRWPT